MLNVKELSRNFGALKALSEISFTAGQGEIISILGPNGAGKTTLLRLLSGNLAPDKGKIVIDGINLAENRVGALRLIGYIPENSPMYDEMSACEFIRYAAELRGVSTSLFRSRLDALTSGLELSDVLSRKIAGLSKGYRHRIGIAAALIHSPKVLIMDEPSEGLDPTQKHIFRRFIKDFSAKGIVLMSTHILEDVEALAGRILLIDEGRLVCDTTPSRLRYQMPDRDLFSAFRSLTGSKKKREM